MYRNLQSESKQLKRTGFGAVEHKAVIGDSDLAKLKAHDCFPFNVATPCGLQNKVWFDIYVLYDSSGPGKSEKHDKTYV